MEKPNLKPNGPAASAMWIDECAGMIVNHPSMQAVISPSFKRVGGSITIVSTPKKPFGDAVAEFNNWYWFENTCKATSLGRLLYE